MLSNFPVAECRGNPHWKELRNLLSTSACAAYRELFYDTPGFVDFFGSATPVGEIAGLNIGSRRTTRRTRFR